MSAELRSQKPRASEALPCASRHCAAFCKICAACCVATLSSPLVART